MVVDILHTAEQLDSNFVQTLLIYQKHVLKFVYMDIPCSGIILTIVLLAH